MPNSSRFFGGPKPDWLDYQIGPRVLWAGRTFYSLRGWAGSVHVRGRPERVGSDYYSIMSGTDEISFRAPSGLAKGRQLPWDVLREHTREVLEGFTKVGLTPNPSSRIARYVNLLDKPPIVDERTLYRFLHYRIDVRMLRTILNHLHGIIEFRP